MWVGLLPGAVVLSMLAPSVEGLPVGMGEALGCGGGGSWAPRQWTTLGPTVIRDDTGAVPVATDGFFTIAAVGNDLSLELAQAQLRVAVRDEGGAEVPGSVSVLPNEGNDWHLFGWTPRDALTVGTRLTATLTTDPPTDGIGGDWALEVEGEPTSPGRPQAAFGQWGTFYGSDGSGELVSCRASDLCNGERISLPAHLVEKVSARAVWTAPDIVGSVAWRIRVEAAAPAGEADGKGLLFFGNDTEALSPLELGRVDFRDRAQGYCINVVLEDLRTGLEQRSELCSPAGPLERFDADGLYRCVEPPSAELTPLWCEMHQGRLVHPLCRPTGDDQPADAGNPSGELTNSAAPAEERSLSGCAIGGARSAPPAFVALAGLVLTSLVRRWMRRHPAR
jgi:hypothetical protein